MSAHQPHIAYLTSQSAFSAAVLSELLGARVAVRGVLSAGDPPEPAPDPLELPVAKPERIRGLSEAAGIGFARAKRFDRQVLDTLHAWAPDVLVCACLTWKVPEPVRALPRLACLNLHTSLLPAYRGPAPVFWQLRAGETESGVTLHAMTEKLDAGPLVSQRGGPIEPGTSGPALNRALARIGAELVVAYLDDGHRQTPREQDEASSSYFPWPREADFELSTQWSARRAFTFMRGTREYGCPYPVRVDGEGLALDSALMFSAQESLGAPLERFGADVRIQFSPGVVHATLARPPR